jgi:hypothetical protein
MSPKECDFKFKMVINEEISYKTQIEFLEVYLAQDYQPNCVGFKIIVT